MAKRNHCVAFILGLAIFGQQGFGLSNYDPRLLERGFKKIDHVSRTNFNDFVLADSKKSQAIDMLCSHLKIKFKALGWDEDPCGVVKWQADLTTRQGNPLLYAVFGEGNEVTLFLGGVHPDELTPIHLTFKFARFLNENRSSFQAKHSKIVVAPLINPDGFIKQSPTRSNGQVDVNRNFFTLDWYHRAQNEWVTKGASKDRYFPGYFPNTEIETIFQIQLLDIYEPDRIFSVHAPLGFYDYDGPGDQKPIRLSSNEKQAKQLVYEVSRKSENYRIVDYSFFPGSLGNFAGNERNLPTITLELETTKPNLVDSYWKKFLPALMQAITYSFKKREYLQIKAPKFYRDFYAIEATKSS